MYLNLKQQKQIAHFFGMLQEFTDPTELRLEIETPMLDLLKADNYVSYEWHSGLQRYANHVTRTMSLNLLRDYDDYYHRHDIVTPKLERFDGPTIAEHEVGEQRLRSSVFYNEFLQQERMTSGVNLFLRDRWGELGDLRIWRSPRREAFGDAELAMLRLLQPSLCVALRRCKRPTANTLSPGAAAGPSLAGEALSPREQAVATLAARGLPDKQIARELKISFTTVRTHLGHAYRKLAVANRVELARRLQA